jgi:rifampicin phosphotransferase
VSDRSDPLHSRSAPDRHWTTANLGEAMPGVASALSATVWGDSVDRGLVAGAFALGAISSVERTRLGPPGARLVQLFHGRAAVNADFLALLGDRMPGASGEQVVRSLFGHVPATMAFHPTARRYPFVAVRLPASFATQPRRVRELVGDYDAWWSARIRALERADAALAAAWLREAAVRMERAVVVQSVAVLTCVQPVYEALANLVRAAGVDGLSLLSAPPGGAESAVVADLWKASRGELSVARVAARHGFHGPHEGELSARVWREDHATLERLIDRYRDRADSEAPARKEAERDRERAARERDLLAAVSPLQRPVAGAVLSLVRSRVPLRGVAKRSMLQSLDVARAAARVIGGELASRGRLEDPDDIFHLTLEEALHRPPDASEIVAERRRRRAEHARAEVPELWRGDIDSTTGLTAAAERDGRSGERLLIEGAGVSDGVVEGRVRVVTDPSFAEVEPDEVLVAPTTDPSWSAIMFISKALVVDIGGALSHAAVVARELGIPCVVNTRSGSRELRTGDRVRVDGGAGRIEILERRGDLSASGQPPS